MKKILWIILCFFACPLHAAGITTGNHLFEHCKYAVYATDGGELGQDEWFKAGICLGSIQGIRDMNQAYEIALDSQPLFFCIPEKVTLGQLSRIVVNYAKNNPALLHMGQKVLAISALKDTYPCDRNTYNK